jgi:hypothetical protein
MILFPPDIAVQLIANFQAACDAREAGVDSLDPCPVVKLFSPIGSATWLATELYADNDTLFGLADLGFGCPELSVFSLREIASLRLPFSLRIERDLSFATSHPLSVWAETARRVGSIQRAEAALHYS